MSRIKILTIVCHLFLCNIIFAQCNNPDPTTTDNNVTFCATEDKRVSDLVAIGGEIVWFDAMFGGTQYDAIDVLVSGVYYADDVLAGGCSPNRLPVTVTINGNPPTNVNISVTVCETDNPTINNLSATGDNIQWYDSETGGTLLPSNTSLSDGGIYWVQQTENGCTSRRLATQVGFLVVSDPTLNIGDEIQEFCGNTNPTVNDLAANGDNISWYASLISQIPLPSNLALVDGEDYWATNTYLGCEGAQRVKVDVVIESEPNAGSNSTYAECDLFLNDNTVNLFDFLNGSPDTGGVWSGPSTLNNGHLGTFDNNIHQEGNYTYTVTSTTGICSNNATATISVTINTTAAPTTTNTTQQFCD
ncbi:MAG: hypothetical protein ACPGUH_06795, partial [Winogradskyella sp.]